MCSSDLAEDGAQRVGDFAERRLCLDGVEDRRHQIAGAARSRGDGVERRTATIARGLIRLGEMEETGDDANCLHFACGHAHDALIAQLLVRAPNVRAAMREAEEMAQRGQLVAPSAQNN